MHLAKLVLDLVLIGRFEARQHLHHLHLATVRVTQSRDWIPLRWRATAVMAASSREWEADAACEGDKNLLLDNNVRSLHEEVKRDSRDDHWRHLRTP